MATNSILKNIVIRDKKFGRDFVKALEHASGKKSKEVVISKMHKDVKGTALKEMFRDK